MYKRQSLITALTLVAIAIATVGLVLGAKASDEKADPADVSAQVDELRTEVDSQIGAQVEELNSAIEQVAETVDTLASEIASGEAQQNDAVAGIDGAVGELQQRVDEIETLLGLDSP